MSTVNAVNSITAPAASASQAPDTPSQPTAQTMEMIAFSSEPGVSLRLLASLPANLGQKLDASV